MTALEVIGQTGTDLQAFVDSRSTLLLSTLTPQGEAFASCTSFIAIDGELYVAFSELAIHAVNLRNSGQASVLLAGDHRGAKGRRISFRVRSTLIEPESEDWMRLAAQVLPQLAGNGALSDLKLFRLSPEQGYFVSGTASAPLTEDNQVSALH